MTTRTMEYFTDETGEVVIHSPNMVGDTSRFIINDLRANPLYSTKSFVTGFPYMVSYAEVPIISPLGYILGSICVVDNKLRNFNTPEIIGTLTELAGALMNHLELMRLKQTRTRSERLLKGLGDFVDFDSLIPTESRQTSVAGSAMVVFDAAQEVTVNRVTEGTTEADGKPHISSPPTAELTSISSEVSLSAEVFTPDEMSSKALQTAITTPSERSSFAAVDARTESNNTPTESCGNADNPVQIPPSKSLNSTVSGEVIATLDRATAMIRETMDLDGFVVLDACPSAFGSRSHRAKPRGHQDPFHCYTSDGTAASDGEGTVPQADMLAGSFLHSTDRDPVLKGLAEDVVQRLIRRFPRGHVFSADEHGPIDDRYAPGKQRVRRTSQSRRHSARLSDVNKLFRFMPTARYITFLPIWHYHRESWFGATFGWTSHPTQASGIDDINLLAAFGNSVMAEVSRIEALAVSRAKSDFISSISHEVRAPKHYMAHSLMVNSSAHRYMAF